MRNTLLFLSFLGATLVAMFVLVPILGVVLLVVAGVLVLGVLALLAAPLLAKLPWFRNRIVVRTYTAYTRPPEEESGTRYERPSTHHLNDGDVIDVEGRELPEKDE